MGFQTLPYPLSQKNFKAIGCFKNTGPDPLYNNKASQSAFNFESLSACQRNAFKWRFTGGSIMDHFSCILGFLKDTRAGPLPMTTI